jgi:hypothetical protein
MKKALLTAALLSTLALAITAGASAHGLYMDTAYNTEKNIERKFPRVSQALCKPLPAWARRQYGAVSEVVGTVRKWNHFYCGVALRSGDICLAVAHMTGPAWNEFIVTGWQGRGCTSRQLRG